MKTFLLVTTIILIFAAIIYMIASIGRFVSQVVLGSYTGQDGKEKKDTKKRNFILKILAITTFLIFAFLTVYISNRLKPDLIFKKPTLSETSREREKLFEELMKLDKNKLKPLTEQNENQTSSSKNSGIPLGNYLLSEGENALSSARVEENTAPLKLPSSTLGKIFNPFSGNKNPGIGETELAPLPLLEQGKKRPGTTKVYGTKIGDIFLYSAYDQIEEGAFARSDELEIIQTPQKKRQLIRVDTIIPALNTNEMLQLPVLLNGQAIPQSSEDKSFSLEKSGLFEALKPLPESELSYFIQREHSSPRIISSQKINQWLKDEYRDMPAEIAKILTPVKNRSDTVKLAAVAAVLRTYFGYNGSSLTTVLEKGRTWNSMFTERSVKNRFFLADCDVLCTYAYIYLKYLDLHPLLLVCQLNASGVDPLELIDKFHATLYVKTRAGWLIFDPTIFTQTFTEGTLRDTTGTDSTDTSGEPALRNSFKNNTNYTIIDETKLKDSDVLYFTLPLDLSNAFLENNSDERKDARLAKIMIELLLFDKKESAKIPTKPIKQEWPFSNIVRFAMISYFLSLILTKLYLFTKNDRKPIFPLTRRTKLIFIIAVLILAGNLFASSEGEMLRWTMIHKIFLALSGSVCVIVGLTAPAAMLYFPGQTKTASPGRALIDHSFLLLGFLFGLAALLYCRDLVSALSFTAMLVVITRFKKRSKLNN